jgi:hypothetical protein
MAEQAAANTETLEQVWERAEAAFPAADRFGIEIIRHSAGFYIGQISRRWVDRVGDEGAFHILSHCTRETAAASLADAISEAHRCLGLGIDWMRKDLPKEAA